MYLSGVHFRRRLIFSLLVYFHCFLLQRWGVLMREHQSLPLNNKSPVHKTHQYCDSRCTDSLIIMLPGCSWSTHQSPDHHPAWFPNRRGKAWVFGAEPETKETCLRLAQQSTRHCFSVLIHKHSNMSDPCLPAACSEIFFYWTWITRNHND